MGKKVVCAITIGDVETKECNTYWLKPELYEKFTITLKHLIEREVVHEEVNL